MMIITCADFEIPIINSNNSTFVCSWMSIKKYCPRFSDFFFFIFRNLSGFDFMSCRSVRNLSNLKNLVQIPDIPRLENRLIEDTDLNLDNKKNAWNSIIKIFKEERGQILEISKKRINNSDNRSEDEVDLDIKLKKFNKLEQQIRIINKIVGIVNLY
ncbi:unnamed protein product [Rhizophagus irregularis]|nr:unnamed protein product [Rhizophagus irregularis]